MFVANMIIVNVHRDCEQKWLSCSLLVKIGISLIYT